MEDHPGHALPALTLMIGGGGLAAITGPTAAAAASPSPSSTCRLGNGVSLGNTGVDLPTVFGSGSPEVAQSNADPDSVKDAEVVCNVNAIVQRQSGDEDTIAAVFCELDPHGWLHVISCGHPPPLLVTPKGARLLEHATTPRHWYWDWDWDRPRRFRATTSIPVIGCCCTPTACSNAATTRAPSSGSLRRLRRHGGGRTNDDIALLAVQVREARAATVPSRHLVRRQPVK